MAKIPNATANDYKREQGGLPKIKKEGRLTIVTHDYPGGEGMIVTSHKDHGSVILETQTGPKNFMVDLLKKFHGDPCEKESVKLGGERYSRTSEKKG